MAYYDIGNIDHGLGSIHTKNGKLILGKNEVIVTMDTCARCKMKVKMGRGNWFFLRSPVFPDKAQGTIYQTDRRFVFIRKPPYKQYVMKANMTELANCKGLAFDAKQWLRTNKYEIIEIPMSEVKKSKRDHRGLILYSDDKVQRFKTVINSLLLAVRK